MTWRFFCISENDNGSKFEFLNLWILIQIFSFFFLEFSCDNELYEAKPKPICAHFFFLFITERKKVQSKFLPIFQPVFLGPLLKSVYIIDMMNKLSFWIENQINWCDRSHWLLITVCWNTVLFQNWPLSVCSFFLWIERNKNERLVRTFSLLSQNTVFWVSTNFF